MIRKDAELVNDKKIEGIQYYEMSLTEMECESCTFLSVTPFPILS